MGDRLDLQYPKVAILMLLGEHARQLLFHEWDSTASTCPIRHLEGWDDVDTCIKSCLWHLKLLSICKADINDELGYVL